jgi:hypothetical protein
MQENPNYYVKLFIASVLSIFIILFSWSSFYKTGCYSLLFPLLVLVVVSLSYIDKKMNERRCFKDCYFKESSKFSKILLSRIVVSFVYFILSIVLTLSIMYGIITYPTLLWWYLVVHVVIVIFIYKSIIKLLQNTIQARYLDIFAREWTIALSSLLLFLVYIYIFTSGYEPEYLGETLAVTMQNASNSVSSRCFYIDYILRIKMEIDGTFWWIATKSSESLANSGAKSVIWVTFITINSLAILGLNRFIVQSVYLINKFFRRENEK